LKKFLTIIAILLSSTNIAYAYGDTPGYISRSCSNLNMKESITVVWGGSEYIYTRSYQAKKTSYSPYYRWERNDSNSGNQLIDTWRSYAGGYKSNFNDYYPNVAGYHWWWNPKTQQIERRDAMVTNCNLSTWGWNNW